MFMLPTSKAIMPVHIHASCDCRDIEKIKFYFFIQVNYTLYNTNNTYTQYIQLIHILRQERKA